ncbi:MAG: hypothetical protein AAFR61_01550 [Bacteroidota bacterium]
MPKELRDIEPFYGWLEQYNHEKDPRSPFHSVNHSLFYYDRSIHNIPAHPLWDQFGSEGLLVKILYVDYGLKFAILELFGEWNDLFENDFKLLAENVLTYLLDEGVNKFILILENVFHIHLEGDDYYAALQDELEDGWMCGLRMRQEVKEEMDAYNISSYFYWNPLLDELPWRRLKPIQLYQAVENRLQALLD